MRRLSTSTTDFAGAFAALLDEKREAATDVSAAVATIISDVQARGDAALIDFTKRFDRFDLNATNLRVSAADMASAKAAVPPATFDALKHAAARIEAFHARVVDSLRLSKAVFLSGDVADARRLLSRTADVA